MWKDEEELQVLVKHKLIAEVIKHWRSSSEERALAEAILYMTGLHLTEVQKLSTQELTDVLIKVIRRPEEKVSGEETSTVAKQEGQEISKAKQGEDIQEVEQTEGVLNTTGQISDIVLTHTQERTTQEPEPEQIEEYPSLEEPPLSFIEAKKLKRGRKPNGQVSS